MKQRILIRLFVIIFSLVSVAAAPLYAQLPKADTIKSKSGDIVIQPVFHAGIVIQYHNKTIYVDPYNGANLYQGMQEPDLVLITDIHPDHMDTATLSKLPISKATLVVPQAVAAQLPANYKNKEVVLSNGQSTVQKGISIRAIPMYNLPNDSTARHPKGRGNGYILVLGDKQIYISGDTEDIPEMRNLKNIDVAFVCMNIPYTMTVEQAADAVLAFRPKIVYPYHYRNQNGFSDTQKFKSLVNEKDKNIDVRLRDWYAGGSSQ